VAKCKGCGREFERTGLSRRGLCQACGSARVRESIRQMTEQKGPIYDRYKTHHKAAMALRSKGR